MYDDTPIYRELIEATARSRMLLGTLSQAVFREHQENHEGPIRYCRSEACRVFSRQSPAA